MADNEVLTRTSRCRLDLELGIIVFDIFPDADQSVEDARENLAAIAQLTKGKRCPVVINMVKAKGVSREARACYAGPEGQAHHTAIALVTGSPVTTMIANMFLSAYGSKGPPTKLFTSMDAAIQWAKEHGGVR